MTNKLDKLDGILINFRYDTIHADRGCDLPDIGLVKTKVLNYLKKNARIDGIFVKDIIESCCDGPKGKGPLIDADLSDSEIRIISKEIVKANPIVIEEKTT